MHDAYHEQFPLLTPTDNNAHSVVAGNGHRDRRHLQARRLRRRRAAPYLWPVAQAGHAGLRRAAAHPAGAGQHNTRGARCGRWRRRCGRGRLTIAALGDSITAGHDNFYNQSWVPQLWELSPRQPLQEAGIRAFRRELRRGNMGEYPWTAGCLNHRLGDRLGPAVDLVTWNWALHDDAPARASTSSPMSRRCPGGPSSCRCRTTMSCPRVPGRERRRACRRFDHGFWDAGARIWRENAFFLGEAYVPGDAEAALLAEINAAAARAAAKSGRAAAAACAREGGTPAATSWRARRPPREAPPRAVLAPAAAAAHFDAESPRVVVGLPRLFVSSVDGVSKIT